MKYKLFKWIKNECHMMSNGIASSKFKYQPTIEQRNKQRNLSTNDLNNEQCDNSGMSCDPKYTT